MILNREIHIFPLIPNLIHFDEKKSLIMGEGLNGLNVQQVQQETSKKYLDLKIGKILRT